MSDLPVTPPPPAPLAARRARGEGVHPFLDTWPRIAEDVFIAPGAQVIGDVEIGAGSSLWYNVVVRGDVCHIRIGRGTNIQDGSVVHVTRKTHATIIGDHVLIGHMAMIHGCEIHDHAFVGLSTVVMDGCVIEEDGMLAAGSLLPPGKVIRKGELWIGRPAKFLRRLSEEEIAAHRTAPPGYAELAKLHAASLAAARGGEPA
ncbi:MAG: gamma carbonic anhydrase family protein [Rhodothalassiaceae bacterium]|nr:MAG: gamma carbonic anhydrase family protein [Rhodothalassiaceae bacterium]